MNEGFEKLKNMGAQKIHEQTHIAKHHVQAVLHESYDDLNKIQLLGFISILEREYGIDLSELRDRGVEYFNENIIVPTSQAKVFLTPKPKKILKKLYITVALVILVVGAIKIIPTMTTDSYYQVHEIDNSAIENAKSTIIKSSLVAQEVETPIVDTSLNNEKAATEVIDTGVIESFSIIPKKELWIGYLNLETYRKRQTIINEEMTLDSSNDWLLSLGHGHVDFEINGKTIKYNVDRTIRLKYIDGNLKRIKFSEFKELNKGNKW